MQKKKNAEIHENFIISRNAVKTERENAKDKKKRWKFLQIL